MLGRRLSSVPVAGGVEASPLPDTASVPPGQILGAAGDCMPAAREHANSTFPWARFKKNPPANACGGQGLRRRLRRAFLGTFSRFPLFSSPENPSFGDHKLQQQSGTSLSQIKLVHIILYCTKVNQFITYCSNVMTLVTYIEFTGHGGCKHTHTQTHKTPQRPWSCPFPTT